MNDLDRLRDALLTGADTSAPSPDPRDAAAYPCLYDCDEDDRCDHPRVLGLFGP